MNARTWRMFSQQLIGIGAVLATIGILEELPWFVAGGAVAYIIGLIIN